MPIQIHYGKNDLDQNEAFEMWVYGRVLKINWLGRATNGKLVKIFRKEKEKVMTNIIKKAIIPNGSTEGR